MPVAPIEGTKLTSWGVPAGGAQICLDFISFAGGTHRIVLPVDTLSGLMTTLPRMLQSSLDERFPGGCLRIVQRLVKWQLERREIHDGLILKLGTHGGFEVAFASDDEHAGSLGAAQLDLPRVPEPIRPN